MSKPRFSLKTILAVVTLAAVGCAALANPTGLWASVVFSGTLLVFFCATVAAFSRRAAIPFAVFGWGYLALILLPAEADKTIVPHLITSKGLVELESWWYSPPQPTRDLAIAPGGPVLAFFIEPTWNSSPFQRIGHCLFALIFAALAAMVAGWLAARRNRNQTG